MIFIVFDIQMYIFLSTDLRQIKICFVFKIIIKAKEMGGGGGIPAALSSRRQQWLSFLIKTV